MFKGVTKNSFLSIIIEINNYLSYLTLNSRIFKFVTYLIIYDRSLDDMIVMVRQYGLFVCVHMINVLVTPKVGFIIDWKINWNRDVSDRLKY